MIFMAKILFDIDDTLFPSTEFAALARKNAINAMIGMGLEADYDDLKTRLDKIIREKGPNYPRHFDDLCAEMKIKEPARFIAAAVAAYHHTKASIAPFPTASVTLHKLKAEGHQLYIATNGTSVKQWDKLIRLGLALFFDSVFVSEEIGREKDPEFYKKVLEILGAKPQECIMVGDREDNDIKPAKAVGMVTVRMLKGKHTEVPSDADYTIDKMSELIQIVQRL